MECLKPIRKIRPSDNSSYKRRCGVCPPCVIAKAAMWTLRIGLESTVHDFCTFATFTYTPEDIPANGSLSKTDVQLFLRQLRANISKMPTKERLRRTIELPLPRYYFVGEYGAQSERPHYHAVLFGLGIASQSLLLESWAKGSVRLDPFHPNHAAYVARYTTKKSFWQLQPSDGRAKEFSLMSKKPGLALGALPRLAATIRRVKGAQGPSISGNIRLNANLESMWSNGVPESLRYGGKIYPLGPYLRDQLTKMLDQPDRESPQARLAQIEKDREAEALPIPERVRKQENALTRAEHIERMKEIRGQI